MSEIVLDLPYPPSANHYLGRRGRSTYLLPAAVAYHAEVRVIIRCAGHKFAAGDRLRVVLMCTMPDRRRRDLGNVEKVLCDSLTRAGLWTDDSQIDDLRIVRAGVGRLGRVQVYAASIPATTVHNDSNYRSSGN